jgi:putative membrane-bound dehydrogenase-like protein
MAPPAETEMILSAILTFNRGSSIPALKFFCLHLSVLSPKFNLPNPLDASQSDRNLTPMVARVILLSLGFILSSALVPSQAADFPIPYNTETGTIPFLKPADALATLKMPEGFHATTFAAEPDVQQPINITTDARGRLWVCENYTYAERARGFDTNLHDRILIFEDTDHDGRADKRTIFWDQAIELTSALPGFGGVFALCPPKLLFIPDRDGNDIPDSEPEVLLDGFNSDAVRHNIANGLKLGPDGWIYGRHGILATSHVGKPGAPAAERTDLNAGIWRFHPVTHKFEVVCQGTTNPWGHDWDENGQLFFINTVIGHLWHVIPGAYYKRMYGEHPNPYLYELIDQTADHVHWDTAEKWSDIRDLGVTATTDARGGGHAHSGMIIYNGDNWPPQYRNTILTVNYHGKRLNNDKIVRSGATYTATHLPDVVQWGDPWFRGVELTTGPDGSVYVADWSDIGECHDDTGVHRTSGRIYKIVYGNPKPWAGDIAKESDNELVRLQFHTNDWFVRQARQALQERAASAKDMLKIHRQLTSLIGTNWSSGMNARGTDPNPKNKLRALWALFVTGGFEEQSLEILVGSPDEFLRTAFVQLASDQSAVSFLIAQNLSVWASKNTNTFGGKPRAENSGLVLTFIASAMRKAAPTDRWKLAEALVTHDELANDRVFPLMVWYGIQPDVPNNIPAAVGLAESSQLPKIRRFITRRIFEDLVPNAKAADQITALLTTNRPTEFQLDILTGIEEALRGVNKAIPPASWEAAATLLSKSTDPRIADLLAQLQALFGNGQALDKLRALFADTKADLPQRRRALTTLLQVRAKNLVPLLSNALTEINIAPDAIRGLATLNDADTSDLLLARYNALPSSAAKTEAITALAGRPENAVELLDAIQRGQIKRQEIDATQLRQIRAYKNAAITQKIRAIWPQLDDTPNGKKQLFEKYKTLLQGRTGASPVSPGELHPNANAGHQLFLQTCATCHTLYGEGAKIGPDLTGSDRRNLDYLLDNILDPSGVVPETYRVSNLTLKDGRSLTGIVLTQTDRALTLQTTTEKLTLQKSDIEEIQKSQLSMMPDGLLQSLTDQQVADLFAYLMSQK